jgi:hypothetical protein
MMGWCLGNTVKQTGEEEVMDVYLCRKYIENITNTRGGIEWQLIGLGEYGDEPSCFVHDITFSD